MGVFEKSNGRVYVSRNLVLSRNDVEKGTIKLFEARPRIRVSIFSLNSRGTLLHIYIYIYLDKERNLYSPREREKFLHRSCSFLSLPSSSSSASGSRTFQCTKIVICFR